MSTPALSAEYARVIPARFVTKRDGSPMACMTCGTTLVLNEAFAATNNAGWHSYCVKCAATPAAQIGGLVARIEALVGNLTPIPQNVIDAVTTVQPAIEAILTHADSTKLSTLDWLKVKVDLLAIRTMIGQAKAGGTPTGAPVRSNSYGGKCGTCKGWVEAGAGRIEKINGRWQAFHLDGQCPAATAAAPQADIELGLYLHDDGNVHKVYKTRNDRPAVKLLVPQSTGEVNADGTPRLRGSFQYITGGIRIVREALAAGTAHKLTQDEAAKFGREFSFCVNCGLYLDDDRSLAAGYGPTCAENNRWWYPTYTEASAILGRPAGPAGNKAKAVEALDTPVTPVVEAVTMVCDLCDEVLTQSNTYDDTTGQWALLWVDGTGSEVCSGDDAAGPDYRHAPVEA